MPGFLDAQLEALNTALEGKIDFVGQERATALSRDLLWGSAGIAFLVGFPLQSLKTTFGIFALGCLLTSLVTLPPYSAYRQHPSKWLPRLDEFGQAAAEGKKDR